MTDDVVTELITEVRTLNENVVNLRALLSAIEEAIRDQAPASEEQTRLLKRVEELLDRIAVSTEDAAL